MGFPAASLGILTMVMYSAPRLESKNLWNVLPASEWVFAAAQQDEIVVSLTGGQCLADQNRYSPISRKLGPIHRNPFLGKKHIAAADSRKSSQSRSSDTT